MAFCCQMLAADALSGESGALAAVDVPAVDGAAVCAAGGDALDLSSSNSSCDIAATCNSRGCRCAGDQTVLRFRVTLLFAYLVRVACRVVIHRPQIHFESPQAVVDLVRHFTQLLWPAVRIAGAIELTLARRRRRSLCHEHQLIDQFVADLLLGQRTALPAGRRLLFVVRR